MRRPANESRRNRNATHFRWRRSCFPLFGFLVLARIPVAFALGIACVPVFFFDARMTPTLLMYETFKSYNAFVILAVPFFLMAANLMNSAGITDRLIKLSQALVGRFPGGLGHINVVVSMFFAGISGSSTADAAGIGSLLIPAMKEKRLRHRIHGRHHGPARRSWG